MRRTAIIVLGLIAGVLCYFTFVSAGEAFRSGWPMPRALDEQQARYRLVLITQELETPFWDQVGAGALEQAMRDGASLQVWGSYGKNEDDFLKKIEIAIASKVDGIIVQGLDTDEFKELTKIQAGLYGIPIITVANDVPMQDSLRRTYVGSDHFSAGRLVGEELAADMGPKGKVILLGGSRQQHYQKQRLDGIQDALREYPNIETVYTETSDTRERVIAATRDVLNRHPDADAFIALNANIASAMIQEIGKRSQIEPYHIYSFDDSPESLTLLEEGTLDGMIEQSPETMGRTSVRLMVQWLKGEAVPLKTEGYFTDIRMLKAKDAP
ncbi:sugar ABC transporter substrate-binding protein [Paenibacillus sp.]|uniref:sugar ABC transporter substrate-binding protein n=1 Tax=Paenibacillus sp. TaxID=58172 RepID=UPI002D3EA644|nr:substrate-binding domain-containing protein [Paenibacillus sp.]HZG84808.1 substrate-binding domain-containing protein [Paenibacillus sp.]